MPAPNMNSIPDMDPSLPLVSAVAGYGYDWIQQIQNALTTQFASIGTSVVTISAAEMNALKGIQTSGDNVETRIGDLEAQLERQTLPTAAQDFKNAWWTQDGTTEPHRRWVGSAQRQYWSNVPWAWGTNIPDGKQDDNLIVLIETVRSTSPSGLATNSVMVLFPDGVYHRDSFWRVASNQQQIGSAPWHATEYSVIDTSESTSGEPEYSTICQTKTALCP